MLPRPATAPTKKKKKTPPTDVCRSLRINEHLAGGSSVKQHQRTLMIQLGIGREGEVIGDDALQAYLELFSRPLKEEHIATIVRLFGWQADVVPLGRAMDSMIA
ncbi:hypothetical protein D1007_40145 [Hordeum vulgare]|nr:hypothetical protein D1007_40145 [Hordeum vulgare]